MICLELIRMAFIDNFNRINTCMYMYAPYLRHCLVSYGPDSFLILFASFICYHMSLVVRKPVFRVCTTTEDDWRLEISYLGSRGFVLSV